MFHAAHNGSCTARHVAIPVAQYIHNKTGSDILARIW